MTEAARRATGSELEKRRALGVALSNKISIDRAADADFEMMIQRLRGEPGSNRGGEQ